ncbi:MAG: 5'/3'-nucleotidase SurE [Phycisphaerae bacterium]
MKILLTNDDGFSAPGIAAAYDAVAPLGDVYVVAPSSERSACGHSISLHGPIQVDTVHHPKFGLVHAVNGTPADCVRLAASVLIGMDFDLVVSGINRGANTGVDTFYSGTVAGAREGTILGLKAIALSHAVRRDSEINWQRAAELARDMVTMLKDEPMPAAGFWNVNFPPSIPDSPLDHLHHVPVARETVPLDFERYPHPDPDVLQFHYGTSYWDRDVSEPSDFSIVRDGGIAVTAVPLLGRF